MLISNTIVKSILEKYLDVWSLDYLGKLAGWDLNTFMPKKGAVARGKALGQLALQIKSRLLDKDFVRLVRSLKDQSNLNDYEQAVSRVLNKALDDYLKLPDEFLIEFENTTNQSQIVWEKAKNSDDFKLFSPQLKRIVDLLKRKADFIGYDQSPYDALVRDYEYGWSTNEVKAFFANMKPELRKILKNVRSEFLSAVHPLENANYNLEKMKKLNMKVLEYLGADFERLRLDESSHPFSQTMSRDDARITTRYHKSGFIKSLLATIHEYGHALYEMQSPEELEGSPIAGGLSLGIHESQSRFWENMIGRSDYFINKFTPDFLELGDDIKAIHNKDLNVFNSYFRQINPNLLRVESDEVTYHFHIMLRFEIELGLLEGSIQVDELPELWNAKMYDYLGIKPGNNAEGVLQDIHWSMGALGYFPTYSLGTFLSGIIKNQIESELGDIEKVLSQSSGINKIKLWLGENIHQYGATYTFEELVKRITGKEFNTEPHLKYLEQRYT